MKSSSSRALPDHPACKSLDGSVDDPPGRSRSRHASRLDLVGLTIALACGIHCAAFAVVLMLWPALWLNRRLWESGLWQKLLWVEWTLLTMAWLLASLAMVQAWRRRRVIGPGLLALAGLILLSLAILTPMHGSRTASGMALAGGIATAAAHFWNVIGIRRARK